jgi:hypothetical protein
MAWLPLALAGVGALQGVMGANAQRKAQRGAMMANATAQEYSPWTGMKPEMMQAGAYNPVGAAIGGAAQGGMAGLTFQAQNPTPSPTPEPETFFNNAGPDGAQGPIGMGSAPTWARMQRNPSRY